MSRRGTLGLVVFLAFYLSWQALHWIPGEAAVVGDLFFLPVGAAGVFYCLRAAGRCAEIARLRWFWRLTAAAIACQALGDTTMAAYDASGAAVPYPSLADFAYLGLYPLMLLALLRVPVAPASARQRLKLRLDLATVVLGGAMVIWYLVLRQTVAEGGEGVAQVATSVAYPLGDLILVAGLAVVMLRWSPVVLRRSLTLIMAGLSLFVVADIAYSYAVFHGGYAAGGPLDILWVGALALFALAGASQRTVHAGAPETELPTREVSERRVSWLPFAALATGSVILLSSELNARTGSELILVLTAIVLAGLIATRQFLTQREMIRLQRDLRQAHTELAQLASRDVLTAAANRRAIGETLELEVERARRYRRALAVLFLDVDNFKSVNDDLGHASGDRALAEFASVIKSSLRPVDTLGRWGGEEFLVVLPEATATDATRVAERIRSSIETHNFLLEDGRKLTCSIGVAAYPAEAEAAEALVEHADRAMYEAKRAGRNRVVASTSVQMERA